MRGFVLVLDDLHQLKDPGSVSLIDFLFKRGPPNLHIAAACRRLPAGLEIAGTVLDGQALVLGADELRFSKSEVDAFFDRRLTRREVASLEEEWLDFCTLRGVLLFYGGGRSAPIYPGSSVGRLSARGARECGSSRARCNAQAPFTVTFSSRLFSGQWRFLGGRGADFAD